MEFIACIPMPKTSDEDLAELREQGVRYIEPLFDFLIKMPEAEVREAAKKLSSVGVHFHTCHGPFGGEYDLSLLDEDARKAAVASHLKALQRTRMIGGKVMIIHPGHGNAGNARDERFEKLMVSLDALVGPAEKAGIRLALENMPPTFLGWDSETLCRVGDHFDSPWLGFCFDTGHAHLTEEGVDATFAAMRDRVIAFHLQDNEGLADKHLQPPYGNIDWESFARSFQTLEFNEPIAIEASPWGGASRGQMFREVETLLTQGAVTISYKGKRVRLTCAKCRRFLFGTPEQHFCGC